MDRVKYALKILIQGESEAVSLYEAFSEKAKSEGFLNISTLFLALVTAEKIHINNHIKALGEDFTPINNEIPEISSTFSNILTAIEGEVEENKTLYPNLIKSIKKDCGNQYGKVARLSMTWAQKVEKEHANLLKKALISQKKGEDLSFENISICQVCGNVVLNEDYKDECKVCGHDSMFFKGLLRGRQ